MNRLRVVSCLVSVVALAGVVIGVVDAAPSLPRAALSVSPNRVLDTRNGIGAPVGAVNPGVVVAVPIAQAGNATSVVLNLTATDAVGDGYVTAWPCGEPAPATSNLNFSAAHTVANAVVVKLGAGGVCFSSSVPVHLIADVSGWFTGTADLTSTSPNRILDTRQTHDPLVADQVRELRVAGQPTIGANASMAVLNLTVDRPAAAGWLVAYPCGQPTDASTVNFGAGEVVANLALVDLSGGSVCFHSSVGVDLIVDTFGWSTETGQLKVQSPRRLLDTRDPASSPSGAARSGSTITLNVGGRGGVPATADSAVLTVTVTNPRADGYVTVWPCDQALPNASTINTWPNAQRSNVALVRLSRTDGSVCLQYWSWNGTTTDLIVDAVGWTEGTTATGGGNGTPTPTPGTIPGAAGTQFSESFATDARQRFDWRLQTTNEPPSGDFLGEHDMSMPCGSPTTYRTVHQPALSATAHSNVDVTNSELVWWCAPGNDGAKGHMMTALDTLSIATLSFSPKQTFTNVTRVCWDQNMNNLGEGKWVNVYVVPAADVAAHGGDLAYADGVGIPFGGIPMRLPPGAFDFDWLRGSIHGFKIGADGSYNLVLDQWKSVTPGGMATESASRFTICLDSGAGVVTLERPDGSVDTYPLGARFPTGAVRVIWQDASYNPVKHNGEAHSLTWHWDNIEIT